MSLRVVFFAGVAMCSSLAAPQNLLVNPNFDLDPSNPSNGWTIVGTGTLTHVTGNGYPAPPCARVDTTGSESLGLEQCAPIAPGERLDFSGYSYTHNATSAAHNEIVVSFFASADCSGAVLDTAPTTGLSFPDWAYRWAEWVAPPPGASSARFELTAEANGFTMNISWDTVELAPSRILFKDGFESGDSAAWSGVVGE